MKVKSALLFVAVLLASCSKSEYKLVWEDNFDGPEIDTTVWTVVDNARGGGNGEIQYYAPKNATIEMHPSGVSCLVLNAQKENYKNRPATSARLNTQDKLMVCYGKIEARIAAPFTADGLWPAFWMLGNDIVKDEEMGDDDTFEAKIKADPNSKVVIWPKCGEIDILEMGHESGIKDSVQCRRYNGAFHWGEDFNGGAYPNFATMNTADSCIQGDFHLYTVIWDKKSIKMYLDLDKNPEVEPYCQVSLEDEGLENQPSRYFSKPFFLLLNLSVGGYFTGLPSPEKYPEVITEDWENFQKIVESGALAADGTPSKMYVDYIRIYQKGEDGEQFIINK